jgi:hypothetical protein
MVSTRAVRTYRIVALLTLCATIWTSAHLQIDDEGCLPAVAEEHDASKHVFGPLGTFQHDHCAICHSLGGLKPDFAQTTRSDATLASVRRLMVATVFAESQPADSRIPARAPPSLN